MILGKINFSFKEKLNHHTTKVFIYDDKELNNIDLLHTHISYMGNIDIFMQ